MSLRVDIVDISRVFSTHRVQWWFADARSLMGECSTAAAIFIFDSSTYGRAPSAAAASANAARVATARTSATDS